MDDDPLMHRMLVPRLREMPLRAGVAEVQGALTPEAALADLASVPESEAVAVVSDFNLKAVMNGLQLLREVRNRRPDAYRVLFSGYSKEQLGSLEEGGGADAFLEKPLLLDDLIRPLAKLLDDRFPES